MIHKIRVHNYQSLKDVEVELGLLTVVVGPSNSGKSALVRAFRALAFNESGTDFITKGENKCSISVEVDEDITIEWRKKREGSAEYEMLGTTYSRLNRGVPDDIQSALGIRNIEADSLRLSPQIADQLDSPFLLTESSGKISRIISKITKLDVLLSATATANRDLQKSQRDSDSHNATVQAKADLLSGLEDSLSDLVQTYDYYEVKLGNLEGELEIALEEKAKLERMNTLVETLNDALPSVRKIEDALQTGIDWLAIQQKLEKLRDLKLRLSVVNLDIAVWKDEIKDKEKTISVCPTCGRPMNDS